MRRVDVEDGVRSAMTEDQNAELRDLKCRNWRLEQEAEAYRPSALVDAPKDDPEFDYRLLVDEAAMAGEGMTER